MRLQESYFDFTGKHLIIFWASSADTAGDTTAKAWKAPLALRAIGAENYPLDRSRASLIRRKRTTCPHKGEARYWTISAMGRAGENGVWSYETPHEGVAQIAGYLAFDRDAVRIEVDAPPTSQSW